jgi:hypothetical protein
MNINASLYMKKTHYMIIMVLMRVSCITDSNDKWIIRRVLKRCKKRFLQKKTVLSISVILIVKMAHEYLLWKCLLCSRCSFRNSAVLKEQSLWAFLQQILSILCYIKIISWSSLICFHDNICPPPLPKVHLNVHSLIFYFPRLSYWWHH